ncbi:MAG TPA: DNA polymerase III subunit gamma/tau [Acidobacteriaceae bacterium]|jgi:DNA polymerase-3 subunit gamma/tau|nr:DNA polymerase III subunit gamma/tau [Acidobacteriaceae bacterium]
MSYQVLARKYRPQRFADVAGQEHVTRTLLNALAQNRIAHGYIFSGHRGIGKTTVARILAMALNCRNAVGSPERPTPEPCGTCVACTEIRVGNAVDVIEIDAATNRGIDEIRELREAARYSPARDRYKIYILDEAHQITDAAFNALLKTLEEPPAHVVFMMATTQPEDIPQTIRSRCQHFSFHAVRFEVILQQLRQIAEQEQINAEESALSLLAEAGDGSIRDALSIMDQAIASAAYDSGQPKLEVEQVRSLMGTVSNAVFEQMLLAVKEQNAASMLEQAAVLLDAGNAPQQIARQFVRFLRNCLMAKIAGNNSDLLQVSEEERARAGRAAAIFSEEDLTRFLNTMLRTFDDLGYRQEQRFHLELGLLKLVYTQRLLPLEDILRHLSAGTALPSPSKVPSALGASSSVMAAPGAARPAPAAISMPKPLVAETSVSVTPENSRPVPPENSAALLNGSENATPFAPAKPRSAAPALQTEEPAPMIPADDGAAKELPDAELLRTAICSDLAKGGHQTAASLLEAGTWQWNGKELQVQAVASKVMLEMAYTPEAQRIARDCFRRLAGAGANLNVVPEPRGTHAAAPKAPVKSASQTMDHPLVRRAQELFQAEIRSVVNLRERS